MADQMRSLPGVILIEPGPTGRNTSVTARPAWRLGLSPKLFSSTTDARSYGLALADRAGLLLVDLSGDPE